jgi:hypothetical protein
LAGSRALTWRHARLFGWPQVSRNFCRRTAFVIVTYAKESYGTGSFHDYFNLFDIKNIQRLNDRNAFSLRSHVKLGYYALLLFNAYLSILYNIVETNIYDFAAWVRLKLENNDSTTVICLPFYFTLVPLLLHNENISKVTC